uniref:Uncharacterized protein n=1 Tax=Arundo donax TaxID=35708 RepID=A0A0A9BJ58_ARUDO
MIFSITILSV